MKVMLVEDERDVMVETRGMLRRVGITDVIWFDCPIKALESVRQGEAYDLCLTDFNMPGMTGSDLCRELRLLKVAFPIVALTGKRQDQYEGEFDLRLRKYLKPSDAQELVDRFANRING